MQAEGSSYQARLFNLGADYGRVAYHVYLDGEGAEADLSGLYFGFGKQTLDQQITVVHAVPNCRSSQSYRGVLDDESTGIWNGGVDVRPGADGTDSEQSNDNLVLSRKAEVNTMPRLEILADEVSCQHGATVGELDDEALYYLRSRGIAESEARRLLIDGFADQVMDDLSDDVLRVDYRAAGPRPCVSLESVFAAHRAASHCRATCTPRSFLRARRYCFLLVTRSP